MARPAPGRRRRHPRRSRWRRPRSSTSRSSSARCSRTPAGSTCTWPAPSPCSCCVPIVTARLRRTRRRRGRAARRAAAASSCSASSCCSASAATWRASPPIWIPGGQLTMLALPVAHRLVGGLILGRRRRARRARARPAARPRAGAPLTRAARASESRDDAAHGEVLVAALAARARAACSTDLVALTKPRVVADGARHHRGRLLRRAHRRARTTAGSSHLLIGTLLAAGGTLALNQYWERDVDALHGAHAHAAAARRPAGRRWRRCCSAPRSPRSALAVPRRSA